MVIRGIRTRTINVLIHIPDLRIELRSESITDSSQGPVLIEEFTVYGGGISQEGIPPRRHSFVAAAHMHIR